MHVVDIFTSYSTFSLPGHLVVASGLPFSKARELQSLVQIVDENFTLAPSTETSTVDFVSEHVLQPSAPSTSKSTLRPEIFMVR
jgi:hypothetical protein